MAGETQKTTAKTNADAGTIRDARKDMAKVRDATDKHQFAAATELEAADKLITNIALPSNSIVRKIEIKNDDMDTHACSPTLVMDIGLAAGDRGETVTSGTATMREKGDILSTDALVDGSTTARAANTTWTELALDGAVGTHDKELWEVLGYDKDPHIRFNVVVTSQAASAALSAAADLEVRVEYVTD